MKCFLSTAHSFHIIKIFELEKSHMITAQIMKSEHNDANLKFLPVLIINSAALTILLILLYNFFNLFC